MVEIVAIREFIELFSLRSFRFYAIAICGIQLPLRACEDAASECQPMSIDLAQKPEAKVEVGVDAIHTPIATRTRDN
ncbi:hypothetical protein [Tardiphaga sp.]|jgi:hypothetical protein|uniref:hypothetical protein n=1 Tax=Tardiphaga sp. TaxID=1926292 RepID=UPI0037D9A029